MKNLYATIALLLVCSTLMAQRLAPKKMIKADENCLVRLQHKPIPCNRPKNARKVTEYENFMLQDNQYIVANSTSDEYAEIGYSGETNKDVEVGAILYPEYYEKLTNCKALGIRFCLYEDTKMRCVTLFDENLEHDAPAARAYIEEAHAGWNYVPFDEPVDIPPYGCMITYTYYEEEGHYPLCNWPDQAFGGYYCIMPKEDWNGRGDPYSWYDFSGYVGALCIQLIVEADPLPDQSLEPYYIWPFASGAGQTGNIYATLVSNSDKDISSFEYTISEGDNAHTEHIELPTPILAGLNRQVTYPLTVPAHQSAGTYTCALSISKVNDEVVVNPTKMEYSQPVYSRAAQRRSVVEEYTGTGCGYCPRGWVGMEYLKRTYPDTFIGIALHQYNSDDPMYFAKWSNLYFQGAPQLMIDRISGSIDPYFGSGDGLDKDFTFYANLLPAVDVSVTGTLSDDMKKITCNTEVEFLTEDAGRYSVLYGITADGLDGVANRWPQLNYYAGADPADIEVYEYMPELHDFCAGGKYNKDRVGLVFDDVLVGSSASATSGSSLAPTLGTNHTPGQKLTNSYTCTLTTVEKVVKALDYDQLYVVAIILNADGEIANAARARIERNADAIETPVEDCTDRTIYDLSGRRVQNPKHGIYVVGGKKVLM